MQLIEKCNIEWVSGGGKPAGQKDDLPASGDGAFFNNMTNNPERRKILRMGAGLALGVGAKMLGISTANAAVSVDCPIYMFHGIAPGGGAVDRVIRANLNRQSVSVGQLAKIIQGEAELPDKPLFCLTFDDGLLSQYQQAKPVLDRYGVEATFFVMGGIMDDTWEGDGVHTYMNKKQVQEMAEEDYEFGSHSVDHDDLVKIQYRGDLTRVSDQIYHSKEKLEVVIQKPVTSFSYPNGSYTPFTRQLVMEAGYQGAVSVVNTRLQTPRNLYTLGRTRVA